MAKYTVKKTGKADKVRYIVINDKGERCSSIDHAKKEEAERHCSALNAFFGTGD